MNDHRDTQLGEQLKALAEPEHEPTYWDQVRVQVAEEAAKRRLRPSLGARLRRLVSSRRVSLALATVAVTIVAAAVVLFGLPSVTDRTGPQPVNAAEVLRRALHALATTRTMQATAELTYVEWDAWETTHRDKTERYRLYSLADGSYRSEFLGMKPADASASPSRRGPVEVVTYDAPSGVLRDYERGRGMVVTTGYPSGPPDGPAGSGLTGSILGSDLGAEARAIQAVGTLGGAELSTTTYEGRPVWVVTCPLVSAPSQPNPSEEWPIYTFTIDQATCQLIRLQWHEYGILQVELRLEQLRIDAPIERALFRFSPPPGTRVKRVDAGFRRVGLDEIEAHASYAPLVPHFVPSGYELAQAAFAARSTAENKLITGSDVVVLRYTRGFDALTITTRRIADPAYAAWVDPIGYEESWSEMVRSTVKLTSGAFAGTTAAVMILPRSPTPHLWAVKDGLLLTIAGGATQKELVAIADSLAPYGPRDATPSVP